MDAIHVYRSYSSDLPYAHLSRRLGVWYIWSLSLRTGGVPLNAEGKDKFTQIVFANVLAIIFGETM